MSEFGHLHQALASLGKNIANFPIGAACLNDFEPVEEKIRITRESLKHLNSRLLSLKANRQSSSIPNSSDETEEETIQKLQEATSYSLINNKAIKLCLHSNAIQAIVNEEEGTPEMQEKVCAYMRKLFSLNDNILAIQESIESAVKKQLKLKMQCQSALFEYKHFLKEQEELQSKRLQETNPEIARNKDKMNKTLQRVNVMKKLITNFIAASGYMLQEEPLLLEMLEKHRETLNVETILKMSQSAGEDES
ncbi:hypothetical protein KM043_005860 [Ampulex compressa]|nr:hypothetical protein KM043_005860 [Ampulex compressa]